MIIFSWTGAPEVVIKEDHVCHITQLLGQHLPQLRLIHLLLLRPERVAEGDLGGVLRDHDPMSRQAERDTLRHRVG